MRTPNLDNKLEFRKKIGKDIHNFNFKKLIRKRVSVKMKIQVKVKSQMIIYKIQMIMNKTKLRFKKYKCQIIKVKNF